MCLADELLKMDVTLRMYNYDQHNFITMSTITQKGDTVDFLDGRRLLTLPKCVASTVIKMYSWKATFFIMFKKKVRQNPGERKISPVKLRQNDNELGVISKSSEIKGMEK